MSEKKVAVMVQSLEGKCYVCHNLPEDEASSHRAMLDGRARLVADGLTPLIWASDGILGGEIPCVLMLMGQRMSLRIAAQKLRAAIRRAGEADRRPEIMGALITAKYVSRPVPLDEKQFLESFSHYLEHVGGFKKYDGKLDPPQAGTA